METDITIRALSGTAEMQQAVDLQKIYWGHDMSDIVPLHMLLSMANYGGHVLGAFLNGKIVGLLMGFLGAKITADDHETAKDTLLVMSKRMVVLPEYRNYKIGERLKLAQRDFAIAHGVQLVTWTFDPMLSRNAYLNIHKLGAVGQGYQSDFFGADATNPTLSGDRLVANWWVMHPHTADRSTHDYADLPLASDTRDGLPRSFTIHDAPSMLLEVHSDFQPLEKQNPVAAKRWRDYMREAFPALLDAGYVATDVIRRDERSFYVFTLHDGSFAFKS
jgi:predicted GNAT superfamily acetyltransferase